MAPRHAVLPIGAVLVLGLGVYLFVEVRAQPALPEPAAGRASRAAALPERPPPAPPRHDEPARETPTTPSAPPPRASVAAPATPQLAAAEPAPSSGSSELSGPKLDAAMAEANKAYDRGDYEDAKALAGRLLARDPTNVRMLRVMVSSSCLDGDAAVAQAHYARLPAGDQEQMKVRCARYGITFDKP